MASPAFHFRMASPEVGPRVPIALVVDDRFVDQDRYSSMSNDFKSDTGTDEGPKGLAVRIVEVC